MKKRMCFAAVAAIVAGVAFWLANGRMENSSVSAPGGREAVQAVSVAACPVSSAGAIPETNRTASVRGTKPFVLTSSSGFQKSLRRVAESLGARTVGVLSRNSLLVEADAATCRRLTADSRFSGLREFVPSEKIDEDLVAQLAAGAKDVEVAVVTLSPADRLLVQGRIVSGGGEILKGCLDDGDSFRAKLTAALVAELAACGDVRWLETFTRPRFTNDQAVEPAAMNVRAAWDVHGLSGAGQVVSTSDSGIDTGNLETMHKDLANQVCGMRVVEGCVDHDAIGHGTHTAGSIVGDGTLSDGQIRGTAWGAKLYAWFCGKDNSREVYIPSSLDDMFRPDQENYPTYIHSASWGDDGKGKYTDNCRNIDNYVWKHPDFLPVFSAGNDGRNGVRTIGSPAAAKNVLAVGATQNVRTSYPLDDHPTGDPTQTASFSSRGPCIDGRTKPDVAAPGIGILSTRDYGHEYKRGVTEDGNYAYECGTSMSCPLTAGAVALVREWLMRDRGFTDAEPPTAALMKAIVTGGARGGAVPTNDQGWGRVDIAETLFPSNRAVKLVDRIPFAENARFSWVVETTNAAPLSVQLVWVDPPKEAKGDGVIDLVNDLDLVVEPLNAEETAVFYGNGGTSPDTKNNVESVRLASAAPAKYLVTVDCRNILYDHEDGGAAALYVSGAFDPEGTPEGCVRIRESGEEFYTLDTALATVSAGETIEILSPVKLRAAGEIAVNCTIVATNDDPSASAVVRVGGASLTVDETGSLALSNVVFSSSEPTPAVVVRKGGRLRLFDGVDFAVPATAAAVRTYGSDGLELSAPITRGFTLDCAVATLPDEVFGLATCDFASVTDCVSRIANDWDERGELRGVAETNGLGQVFLKWGDVPVPLEESVGYFVDKFGNTNTAARLDRLLEKFEHAQADGALAAKPELVIRNLTDLSLSRPLTVTSDLTLRGEDDVVLADIAGSAGFTVTGGRLTVNGISFCGYKGNGLFVVNGDAAALTLESDVAFAGIEGTNYHSGAVAVLKGTATVSGASFEDCFASGAYDPTHVRSSYGGAIYIGQNCGLELNGGSITGCRAATDGGGVYAWAGSAVSVGGDLTVSGNTSGGKNARGKIDDIGLRNETVRLVLANEVKEGDLKRIGIRCNATCTAGATFATVAAGVGKAAVTKSADAFLNDHDLALCATVSADGKTLQWTAETPDYRTDDPDLAVIRISGRGEPVDGQYWSVDHAFEALTNGTGAVTAELLKDASFVRDIPIGCPVVFRSEGTEPLTLTNDGDTARILVSAAGQLTLTNLVLNGGSGSAGLIRVESGKLTLESGARIEDVVGLASRDSGAVSVWNHGTFVMKPGAEIVNCANLYWNAGTEGGYCGGLLLDASTATISGGAISNCTAGTAGGAFFGNGSEASISGPVFICGNSRLDGAVDDLRTADLSRLLLTDVFTGSIGVTEGALSTTSDPNVFGEVAASFSGDDDELANSARRFRHDVNGDYGQAVRGHGKTLLVWGSAIVDGKYVAPDGTEYDFVVGGDPVLVDAPAAVEGLVYTGFEQVGVPEGIGYLIVGNRATEVGTYTATATPRDGFAWSPDGKTAPSNIVWTIAAPPEPDPQWEVVTNVPGPIAFRSIRRVDAPETAWELVITNRVPYCNYRLIWTEDLTKGFTTTGAWEQAVGEESAVRVWTTNVVTTGAARFWRAEGAEGTNWVLKAEK